MVSLDNHQLLVWPTLIYKTLPQLGMKARPRCGSGGHYRDSANNFSNRLVKLMQTDAFHGLQLSFQRCQVFWHCRWNVGTICTNRLTHGVHKLHQSHEEEGFEDRKLWRKPAAPRSNEAWPKMLTLVIPKIKKTWREKKQTKKPIILCDSGVKTSVFDKNSIFVMKWAHLLIERRTSTRAPKIEKQL